MKASEVAQVSPKIGAFVLETLTSGMYTNPLDALRELVQNCADAIREAEELGKIPLGKGRVVITINPKQRTLIVRDNGVGVPVANIKETLQDIGMSNKRVGIDAGFRGIGRLAAIAYCKTIHFRTSFAGEKQATTLTLDCCGIKKACVPSMRKVEELSNVLHGHTTIQHDPHSEEDHFFEVELNEIEVNSDVFLDLEGLKTYLSQVAPVEFDAQSFVYSPVIRKWRQDNKLDLHTISLVVKVGKTEYQIFKPYKTHYKTRKTKAGGLDLEIKNVRFFPENPGPDAPFWLWYGISDLLGSIDDLRSAGFRIRKHNISLGGADGSSELFTDTAESNERFNNYFIGEIHIRAEDAIPNARRDGFEDGSSWQKIKDQLVPFFADRVREIRDTSKTRNLPVQKLTKTVQTTLEETSKRLKNGFASDKQRADHVESLRREQKKLEEARHSERDESSVTQITALKKGIDTALKSVEKDSKFTSQNLDPALDRKQRKVIKEILEILHIALDADAFAKAEEAIMGKFCVTGEKGKK